MKLKVIIGIAIIVILGGTIYTYINKKNDGSKAQPITNETTTTTASAVTNTTKQSINQNNTSDTNNANNSKNVSSNNLSSNNVSSNNSNVSSSNTIQAANVKSDSSASSNNVNTNNTTSETSKNNISTAQTSNSSNKSSITQNNNTNSNAENLQPNNNAEVSKYFGNWVVGKQVGSTIGTGEIYKSYEGDKIILTKDLFSFQGTTIKDPIYYIQQVNFGAYFGESQYDNYGNVKIDAQGNLAMLLVRPKSDPYTKSEFEDAFPTLGIILSGDQLITHGGGDGGTAINDCNRIN